MDADSILTPKLKKNYVEVAIAQDRALAKDYRDLLMAQGISAEIHRCQRDVDQEEYDHTISVKNEDFDLAVKVILSRNPGEYFFDTLFSQDNLDLQINEDTF